MNIIEHRTTSDGTVQGMAAMVRRQLENLRGIIDLESGGAPLNWQALRLTLTSQAQPDLWRQARPRSSNAPRYDSAHVYRTDEPRLGLIADMLGHLGRHVRFEANGKVAQIDGFRLKDLSFWARYPTMGLLGNFGEFSTYCSCDCEFCFLKGSRMIAKPRPMLSVGEAKTRARYYLPAKRVGLPTPSATPGEPFTNPRALELLRIARVSHADDVLDVTTCGDFLTEKVIDALAELKPVHIALSLNSSNSDVRRRTMRSRRPEVAIAALPLLRERGIQFTGSIVPSPNVPLDDVAETMEYLDRHAPLQIRLLLPGYTKYANANARFDTQVFWDALVELGAQMRGKLQAPLLIQPGFYWNQSILPTIDGIFPNSPAARAGLRYGDRIVRVNAYPVITRAEAVHFLEMPPKKGDPWTVQVEVVRQEKRFTVALSNELPIDEDWYPYKPRGYPPSYNVLARWSFGMQFLCGFDLGPLRTLKQIVEKHPGVRRVLVFTTPLVQNLYAQALQIVGDAPECKIPEEVEVRVTIAQQNFWGGNIIIGDLHVVSDYVDHLRLLADLGYHPDLVIIPSSFTNSWGFDVLGQSFREIERRSGVTVELLPVRRVMV
jgi:hypothetical protein